MTRPEEPLAARLRNLRAGRALTQKDLGRALGASVPLLSSWENGIATPPPARLEAYARLFAADPPPAGGRAQLPKPADLTGEKRERYEHLLRELIGLRGGGAVEPAEPAAPHPLRFPAGQAITIICSELPEDRRSMIGYADPQSPDFVESYKFADLDALIALLPHLAVLNPTSEITIGTWTGLTADHHRSHLIALGGVDFNELMQATLKLLTEVPVSQLGRPSDDDIGGFQIREESGRVREVRPRLEVPPPAEGADEPADPAEQRMQLVEDVAHFLRAPNPFNRKRTITFFGGMYSRGSLGVVRALTEPELKDRNAEYLARRFQGATTYSIVCPVRIHAGEVIVPDWAEAGNRLHEWPW